VTTPPYTYAITGEQAQALADRATRVEASAKRNRRHLWVATVVFRVDPPTGFNTDPESNTATLDVTNLFAPPMVGCFVCERAWFPGMQHTDCPGDPADPK
jgi:hypothetical protein